MGRRALGAQGTCCPPPGLACAPRSLPGQLLKMSLFYDAGSGSSPFQHLEKSTVLQEVWLTSVSRFLFPTAGPRTSTVKRAGRSDKQDGVAFLLGI